MKSFPVCKESKNSSEQCPILDLKYRIMFKPCIKNQIIFGISCLERSLYSKRKTIQNFWSPKQPRRGFRISDPQTTQGRIRNFWSPKKRGRGFRFLIPQRTQQRVQNLEHRKRFRISHPLKWQTQGCWISDHLQRSTKVFRISDLPLNRIPKFLSPKNIASRGIKISDHPNNLREKKFLSGLKAVTTSAVKVNIKGFWSKLKTDYKFHHINFIQSVITSISNVVTLNHIIEDRV